MDTLLEMYGLQLPHRSPHSITLVAIFMHLYEMYVGVRQSMRLFRLYHALRSIGRDMGPISGFYFQHKVKSPAPYIIAISPNKWECWRLEWVVMQG
jgi:hypothetical protein